MNKQTEYDKHIEYVSGELERFHQHAVDPDLTPKGRSVWSEIYARDIVQWVTSKPASRWPSKDFHIGYWVGGGAGVLLTWLASTL